MTSDYSGLPVQAQDQAMLLASGGPQQWAWVRRRGLGAHKPISGQMMNKVFGGTVDRKSVREDGVFSISVDNTCTLFR